MSPACTERRGATRVPTGTACCDRTKSGPLHSILASTPGVSEAASDRWLEHAEAAKYLGVAKSTLYRYASQNRIEHRKYAGRLEYRASVLEKHKQAQVRPARFPLGDGGIIRSALSSGK